MITAELRIGSACYQPISLTKALAKLMNAGLKDGKVAFDRLVAGEAIELELTPAQFNVIQELVHQGEMGLMPPRILQTT